MKAERIIRTGDDPVLKQVCEPVAPGEPLLFLETMAQVCKRLNGAGLAAPQIGVTKRVIFVNCRDAKGSIRRRFMINPVITAQSEHTAVGQEGCLSYPGVWKHIARPVEITVEYLDEKRVQRRETLADWPARVVCHEVDHLNGICKVGDPNYPDDVSYESRINRTRLAAALAGVALAGMPQLAGR